MNATLHSAGADETTGQLMGACERLLDLLRSEAQSLREGDVARIGLLSSEKNSLLAGLRQLLNSQPVAQLDGELEIVVRECQRQNAINGVTLGLTRANHLSLLRTLRNEEASPVYKPSGDSDKASSRSLGSA